MGEYLWLANVSFVLVVITGLCFLYQTVYLILPYFFKKKKSDTPGKPYRYAILIAARNEELVLPHLLDSIRKQDYPAELITTYVVADNCTDATAKVAQQHGAKVYPRFNKEQIGKGYALDYLLKQIHLNGGLDRYDAFLVFDADNLLQPDYITNMNRTHSQGYEAFCGYRNTKNYGTNWISSGYGLWYIHESTHLNRCRMHNRTCCAVSGTGFGFTTDLLKRCGGWKFFTLTEDIEFSVWCATRGINIGYCHDAILYDEQPTTFCQSWRQRTRWAQGGIQVSFRYAWQYLKGMLRFGRTGYSSFEMLTLSLWGVMLAMISVVCSLISIALNVGFGAFALAFLGSVVTSYVVSVIMAVLTMSLEWDRIRATSREKVISLFTFPFFMMTWLPITLLAPFQKFGWAPIAHTVAISAESLQK